MFDLTSSKLLILGLVALIVVGPKDLPLLLRTVGKYLGMIRRQANEFRAQFDEAMRDQELANLKAEMEAVKSDVTSTVTNATSSLKDDLAATTRDIDNTIQTKPNDGWHDPIAPEPTPAAVAKPLDPHELASLEHSVNGAVTHAVSVPDVSASPVVTAPVVTAPVFPSPVVSTPASLPAMNLDQKAGA